MIVRIVMDLDVGDTPTADAITYFIRTAGTAYPDDWFSPEEWVELVILDFVEEGLDALSNCAATSWAVKNMLTTR
ncbi:MAG: hypothetical protein JOZ99_02900 [Actinobacteria bacterium]|nr:hypothetical protein [Actinomycetota bacterium]